MLLCITILSLFTFVNTVFLPIYPRLKLDPKPASEAGDPLFLTPYIEKGHIFLAQNLSRVNLPNMAAVESHAGFFTIDRKFNSNLYFWYFLPFSKNMAAPVLLWLQGGPGCSSLYGLFAELGPFEAKEGGFFIRKYHWALNYHLLFIDNPVGSGFSFTKNTNGFCSNQDCVAKGLYQSLHQYFQLFPHLRDNDFYLTGESYAGKYIPSLGMLIHRENAKGKFKINLKGMALGNAYCDPLNQLDYGNYLYQHGLLDGNQLKVFLKSQMQLYVTIKSRNWLQANIMMDRLMDGCVSRFSLFNFYTGFEYYYNYLRTTKMHNKPLFLSVLHKNEVRRAIHVGGNAFHDGETVQLTLALDFMQSVAPAISELLSHYRMLFYNGQMDIIVAYPLTVNFLNNLRFSASDEYKWSSRSIWKVGNSIAGYIKCAGNLTEVLVRNSGHMVPKDQPKWSLDLITRFVNNEHATKNKKIKINIA